MYSYGEKTKNKCHTSTNQTLKNSQILLLNDNHEVLIYYIHPFLFRKELSQCVPHVSSPFTRRNSYLCTSFSRSLYLLLCVNVSEYAFTH